MNTAIVLHAPSGPVLSRGHQSFALYLRAALLGVLLGLLTLRPDTWGQHRVGFMLLSAAAGIVAAALCTLPQRFPFLRQRPWLLGLSAAAGLGAAFLLQAAAFRALDPSRPATNDLLLFFGLLGGGLSLLLFYAEHRHARRQLAASRAQARSLESQIRPHFFFNTLNTISAIIPDQPAEAQRILGQFANLFRGAMAGADGQPVPLTTELALVRDYLEIERARFGDRLRFTLPDPASHPNLLIPALTLQPLVENAVRHGIAKRLDGGEILVTLTADADAYQIVITNPVDEPPSLTYEALLPPGHSLRLLSERLRLLNGRHASLTAAFANGLFQLTLLLPRTSSKCRR